MKKIFIHGTGHRAASWDETIACMKHSDNILCPDLLTLLDKKEATYSNLYDSFVKYCGEIDGRVALCGLSLGGILALQYALDFPDKVQSLVLIGTPHKVSKAALGIQNAVFRFFPKSLFESMAFEKKDIFLLVNSMKDLDFRNRAQDVQCPVLLICGKKDSANMKSALYFQENMKHAKLEIIENAGHVVNEDNPGRLAEILDVYYSETIWDKTKSLEEYLG